MGVQRSSGTLEIASGKKQVRLQINQKDNANLSVTVLNPLTVRMAQLGWKTLCLVFTHLIIWIPHKHCYKATHLKPSDSHLPILYIIMLYNNILLLLFKLDMPLYYQTEFRFVVINKWSQWIVNLTFNYLSTVARSLTFFSPMPIPVIRSLLCQQVNGSSYGKSIEVPSSFIASV